MPTLSDTAICIRCWDFSETSQTVSLLTRSHGVVRGLAKGAKRDGGMFSGGFDVLTRGGIVALTKPGRDLATLTEWHLECVYWSMRRRLGANRVGLYMADLVQRMITDHDPHPEAFDALARSLEACEKPGLEQLALLLFQWQLLVACGFRPELDHDVLTGAELDADGPALGFSLVGGGTVADTGDGDRVRVRRETIDVLRAVAAGRSTAVASVDADAAPLDDPDADSGGERVAAAAGDAASLPASGIERANRLIAVYYRSLIGSEPSAMRWLFPDLGATPT